ncbi:hypothetical protein SNE33_13405, partial [Lysobacter zhanggongensis]
MPRLERVAAYQAGIGQRGALRGSGRHRRNAQHRQCTRHQQRRLGGVVVQRARAGHGDIGRAGDHRIEPVIAVGLSGPQHRAAAIGDAHRDDSGVVERERGGLRERTIKRLQGELGGLFHVHAPVGLRVVARVGVLDRYAAARRRVRHEGQAVDRCTDRAIRAYAKARIEVEIVGARTLVGVGDGAALRQRPRRRDRDRAEHPARPRCR